jgi:hypothetical protein
LNCGVYIIAFECLSKLFYSFFSVIKKPAGGGAQREKGSGGREGVWVSGCFARKKHPNARYPYSNMKRRMLTFMSRPTHMATVMVDEPP